MHLRAALEFFGDRELHTIDVVAVQEYAAHLTTLRSRGKPLGPGSRRKYLNSLSNLFRRAAAEGYMSPGFNPVSALMDKPQDCQSEARWLEVHEAALFLEASRLYQPDRVDGIPPEMLHAIVATYLLTGGKRRSSAWRRRRSRSTTASS